MNRSVQQPELLAVDAEVVDGSGHLTVRVDGDVSVLVDEEVVDERHLLADVAADLLLGDAGALVLVPRRLTRAGDACGLSCTFAEK